MVPYLETTKVSFVSKKLVLSVFKKKDWLGIAYKVMKATHKVYVTHAHTL